MPRLPLHLASGTARTTSAQNSIRFVRYGCANRPFFHIVVMWTKLTQHKAPVEQLGSFDPLPNKYNEKLLALNFERIQYWIGHGAHVTRPVAQLLGIAGFFPLHPRTEMTAWRNRRDAKNAAANDALQAESAG